MSSYDISLTFQSLHCFPVTHKWEIYGLIFKDFIVSTPLSALFTITSLCFIPMDYLLYSEFFQLFIHVLSYFFLNLTIKITLVFQNSSQILFTEAQTFSSIYIHPHLFPIFPPSANTDESVIPSSSIVLQSNLVPISLRLFVPISLCQLWLYLCIKVIYILLSLSVKLFETGMMLTHLCFLGNAWHSPLNK